MKKLILTAAAGLSALLISACSGCMAPSAPSCYFNASILEVQPHAYLVEITGSGTSGLNIGTEATVSADTASSDLKTGEFARVEFDGTVLESYPVRINSVSAIYQTDVSGNVLR